MDIDELLAAATARPAVAASHPSLKAIVEHMVRRRLGGADVVVSDSDPGGPASAWRSAEIDLFRVPVPARSGGRAQHLVIRLGPGRVLGEGEKRFLSRVAAVYGLAAGDGGCARWPTSGDSRVKDGAAPLVGHSPAMQMLRERIGRVAATDFTVLIEGESGSGKELVARQVHELSRRRRGPFIAVNCAAIVESLLEAELFGIEDRTATGVRGRRGKFEQASGGTLFLDEVADLSQAAQAKLLRAIQDLSVERVGGYQVRRVDIRIVVATNKRLRTLVERGVFRQDLFYRLSGVELVVPPLRSRREDIPELARYFLLRHRALRRLELTAAAADALSIHDWPGNVRELERLIESALTLTSSDCLDVGDLPVEFQRPYADVLQASIQQRDSLREWSRRYVSLVFQRCGENKREACRLLGISYHTLQAHLRPLSSCRGKSPCRTSQALDASAPAPAMVHERGVYGEAGQRAATGDA
jgi:transcriptional regulator with AAA-type ATPase domain